MRLYYANSKGRARLRLRYSSVEAGLPETTVDKVVTFVGGQAPSFVVANDVATILSGTVKTDRPRLAGSFVTVFSVAPALPAGLRINTFSGVISGTCGSTVDADFTITASARWAWPPPRCTSPPVARRCPACRRGSTECATRACRAGCR